MIDKTVNDNAIVIFIKEGRERKQLLDLINFNELERKTILLDFSTTTHLTSAFITDIIAIHERAVKDGFSLIICGMNKLVHDIFSSLGLIRILKIVNPFKK